MHAFACELWHNCTSYGHNSVCNGLPFWVPFKVKTEHNDYPEPSYDQFCLHLYVAIYTVATYTYEQKYCIYISWIVYTTDSILVSIKEMTS